MKIKLASSLLLIWLRIFYSEKHHSISGAFKICVSGKVGDVVEKRYEK